MSALLTFFFIFKFYLYNLVLVLALDTGSHHRPGRLRPRPTSRRAKKLTLILPISAVV